MSFMSNTKITLNGHLAEPETVSERKAIINELAKLIIINPLAFPLVSGLVKGQIVGKNPGSVIAYTLHFAIKNGYSAIIEVRRPDEIILRRTSVSDTIFCSVSDVIKYLSEERGISVPSPQDVALADALWMQTFAGVGDLAMAIAKHRKTEQ